ncbi:DMT family transporter [Gracilinema caldarium]|uniref:DMT family transporter n=1 Tax=Gracilinema caldarium TaxID=215591 RepID=UPI0026F1E1E1|nr:DMT family transporter [Gracilinema caldarium]
MNKTALKADILLVITSIIWGFAFVAQRLGMDYIGPFTYNGVRFALGSLSLLPLIAFFASQNKNKPLVYHGEPLPENQAAKPLRRTDHILFLLGSFAAGTVLFAGASLQQMGMQYTTAGKAGFLTGLYVVLVPIVGIVLGQTTKLPTWLGAILAVLGMYILSAPDHLGQINPGDVLVIISAFFWTFHVLLIDKLSKRIDPIRLSAAQFAWCALYSIIAAFMFEHPDLNAILKAAIPILYGGLGSVGIAYTLQVVAQRDAPPAHSSIIMCLEGVFATLGGILILAEPAGLRNIGGSALMLLGMLATQWDVIFGGSNEKKS